MKKYLEKYQNIAFQTINKSIKNNTLSHSILLNGNNDSPLMEIAKYIASAIVCENKNACGECLNCKRIENESYTDLIVLDGSQSTIKKNDIEQIKERFSTSAIETLGVKIYIINHIENSTPQAINSLLKFLEEPEEGIYAILTTSNINNVFATITSRCQNILLKSYPKQETIVEANKKDVPLEDCLILSTFCGTSQLIYETYNDKNYLQTKELVIEFLHQLIQKEDILYFVQIEISSIIKNKQDFRLLLQLLEVVFFDINNIKTKNEIAFKNEKELLLKCSNLITNITNKIETLMLYKEKLEYNTNLKLLLDGLFINLKEGK